MDSTSGAAVQTVDDEIAAGVDVHNQLGDGAVRFRHDPRLVLNTRVYLTNEQVPPLALSPCLELGTDHCRHVPQVLSFLHGVTAKTLLISAGMY